MTADALVVTGTLTGLAALLVAVTAIRHQVARRVAARFPRRRPAETLLVTVGSLLATAIVTGSFVVGDALRSSLRAGAFTQLGPVDETVTAQAMPPPSEVST